jgi:hypothetical protein
MITRLSRHAFEFAVALLTVGILVLGSFLVLVAVPDLAAQSASVPTPTPSPTASPRSAMALSPVGIEMPPDADCDACHVTTTGLIGTKPIPPMAHPLLGWRNCTACHALGGLVTTAPGHSSLHKDECLICHQTQAATGTATQAPLRPEHMGEGGKQCTDCHGIDDHAPMPDAMKGRGDNCWICHNGEEFTYLFEEASPGTEEGPSSLRSEPDGAPSSGTGLADGPLYALEGPTTP